MAFTFGFYNSVNNDRKYDAVQMGRLFDGVIKDGIFMSIGEKFIVREGEGMIVIVGSGRAWFDHTWSLNDAAMPIEIEQSEVLQDRIDTIVLDIDSSTQSRTNSIIVVKGTPSTTPIPPILIRTLTHNQYPLCDVLVKKGVTEIVPADITNRVGTSDTPFVTGLLETIDVDELLRQWRGQFDDWIHMLEDLLDENVAANLAALITNHINDKIAIRTEGVHGIKYEDGIIKVLDGEEWKVAGASVVDNLISTDTTSALSANQGRILNSKIRTEQITFTAPYSSFTLKRFGSIICLNGTITSLNFPAGGGQQDLGLIPTGWEGQSMMNITIPVSMGTSVDLILLLYNGVRLYLRSPISVGIGVATFSGMYAAKDF